MASASDASLNNTNGITELCLQEDSDDDVGVHDDYEEAFEDLFGVEENDNDGEFLGFSDIEEDSSDDDHNDVNNNNPAQPKDKNAPDNWSISDWKHGEQKLKPPPVFTGTPGFNPLLQIPDDATETYFFSLFVNDDLIDFLTDETNMYAFDYLHSSGDKLGPHSVLKKWPENGITSGKMRAFLALTFYMGIIKKEALRHYWSVDPVLATSFPRNVMSRTDFYNIMSFLHCCNNFDYPSKGEPGYDPRKKLGNVFTMLQERFLYVWTPRQHVSIDEGTIPFRGHIHFKVYNPNKPDKYGIKTFKLCDSTNGYCCKFDLYVGVTDCDPPPSKYGKTYDLVMYLIENYKNKGYCVYMDNFYSSPYLFYNLLKEEGTAACGTVRPRKGLPKEVASAKFKNKGELKVMTHSDDMIAMRILDRKHVTLLSTVYGLDKLSTGRKHWQTKEVIRRHEIIHRYNQYMGGVDVNDQILKYSAFNRRSFKWWKRVMFRLLNLAMANSYILYKEWFSLRNDKLKRISQTEFRIAVIKGIIADVGDDITPPTMQRNSLPQGLEVARLSGRHFIQKAEAVSKRSNVPTKNRVSRSCKVCVPAERKIDNRAGEKRKRPGRETSYECAQCLVPLCVDPCFGIYHQYKDYEAQYIRKNA